MHLTRPPGLDDERGVGAAYAVHGAELYRFALRGLGDPGAAEDVVQETFVRAWRAADRFDPARASLRVWLFAIARNAVRDHARASRARPWQRRLIDPALREDDALADPIEQLLDSWMVEQALRELSQDHRTAIVEVVLRERPYAEVAVELRVPVGTVRSRVFYGLKALRVTMDDLGDDTVTDEHRVLRELLSDHALGGLPPHERARLDVHLDGCSSCRDELAELRPVVARLRRADPDALAEQVDPPADLETRIARRITAERAMPSVEQRTPGSPQRVVAAAAAVLVLLGAVGLGAVIGRQTAPGQVASPPVTESPAPRIPLETVPVVTARGVRSGDAAVIAHTWGVEARFTGSGFVRGERYRAAFRATDGRVLPAGEFVGTGGRTLTCNMQSALLREAAAAFVVLDADGATVLSADLPV